MAPRLVRFSRPGARPLLDSRVRGRIRTGADPGLWRRQWRLQSNEPQGDLRPLTRRRKIVGERTLGYGTVGEAGGRDERLQEGNR